MRASAEGGFGNEVVAEHIFPTPRTAPQRHNHIVDTIAHWVAGKLELIYLLIYLPETARSALTLWTIAFAYPDNCDYAESLRCLIST
jgi:hypothetical protein